VLKSVFVSAGHFDERRAMASWVKELQNYFTAPPHGKKIEISEFKSLTDQDKEDFRAMLIAEGIDVDPVKKEG